MSVLPGPFTRYGTSFQTPLYIVDGVEIFEKPNGLLDPMISVDRSAERRVRAMDFGERAVTEPYYYNEKEKVHQQPAEDEYGTRW